jgi:hypothetical protein
VDLSGSAGVLVEVQEGKIKDGSIGSDLEDQKTESNKEEDDSLPYVLVIYKCSVMIFMSLMIMINDGGMPSFCEIRLRCIIASHPSFSTAAYRECY